MNLRDNIKKITESDATRQSELLQQWKDEAAANLKTLRDQTGEASVVDGMAGYRAYDKAAAYRNITGESLEASVVSWKKWAAAALFIGLVAMAGLKMVNWGHQPIEYAAAKDIRKEVLPDGSEVVIDQQTKLSYNSQRAVSVQGRAFFKVTKKEGGALFTVDLNKGKVTVLGTRFSVTSLPGMTEVAVEEGRVKYTYGEREIILKAGDWMRLSGEDIVSSPILTTNQFSWKHQVLEFKNTPLDQALQDISRHYHQELVISKEIKSAAQCLLTSRFAGENLDQVLDELKLLFQIQYHKSGNRYVITSMKC